MSGDADFAFGTVAIVGVGLIGGSLGMALKARGLARRVVGIGREAARLETARALGAIDAGTTEFEAGIGEADMVVLCTTIGHIISTLPEVLRCVSPTAIVTDVGSTKGAIVAAGDCSRFIGGHPMCGSEKGGVEAASATLFEGATWALTPSESTDRDALATIKHMAQAVGANTLEIAPDAHDAMVAVTSHLPHGMASALARLAAQTRETYPDTLRLAAGSFADMTRVAASSPDIWRDVCLSNRDAVLAALRAYRQELAELEAAVAVGDAARIEAFFAGGAEAKRSFPMRGNDL